VVAGLKTHIGVREIVAGEVVLRREVVGLRLALCDRRASHALHLVHVVRDRAHIVEELAQDIEATLRGHHVSREKLIAEFPRRVLEKSALAVEIDVAQPFIPRRARAVVGGGRRGEPALVDAAAVRPERIEIVRMQLQPSAWNPRRSAAPNRAPSAQSPHRR